MYLVYTFVNLKLTGNHLANSSFLCQSKPGNWVQRMKAKPFLLLLSASYLQTDSISFLSTSNILLNNISPFTLHHLKKKHCVLLSQTDSYICPYISVCMCLVVSTDGYGAELRTGRLGHQYSFKHGSQQDNLFNPNQ